MSGNIKTHQHILDKLGIEKLNPMQEEAILAIQSGDEVVLLSPTGTGKTLAFLLPLIEGLDNDCEEVQILIIVPSRELAIQIEQVARDMGAGYKTNAVYGGRTRSKDIIDIKHRPAILIGTPGRIADHLKRKNFSPDHISSLVLDEFDKSLEVGFEEEMSDIITALPQLKKKVLTSATHAAIIPRFVGLQHPIVIDYLEEDIPLLTIKSILSPTKDKLDTLVAALAHLGNQPGIIFCNFKESIHRISDFLKEKNIPHGCYYGGMDQIDRERVLIKFRNGTHQLIIATDLAARGLDIPEIKFILHYHLPPRSKDFTHRNGRTARMHNEGTAYVLHWDQEVLPDFMGTPEVELLKEAALPSATDWQTLFISGGRKDKISKGDIAGLCCKQGGLNQDDLSVIELKQDCSFIGVKASKINQLIKLIDNTKLKKKKVRAKVI